MADRRARDEWSRFSSLMALLANCHRHPKKGRAFRPQDFDPFARRRSAAPAADITVLRDVFIHRRMPEELN